MPKGNEKDEGKTSPKSIAWAVSKTKDGWRHATTLQRRCTCTTTSGRLSRATRRLQAAMDTLQVPCYWSVPFERATSRPSPMPQWAGLDAFQGSRSQACRGRLSTRTTKTVNSAQVEEVERIHVSWLVTVASADVCPALAAQVPVPARRSPFAFFCLFPRLSPPFSSSGGPFWLLSLWLLLQPSPHSPSAFPRLTQPCTL